MNEREYLERISHASPDALATMLRDATPQQERVLQLYFGPERYRRVRTAALRNSVVRGSADERTKRGNVVIIPGLAGSELSLSRKGGSSHVIWVQYLRLFFGGLSSLRLLEDGVSSPDADDQVTSSGILTKYYAELEQRLLANYRVRRFAYDWRKDIHASASRLDGFLKEEFGSAPVNIVAHSMGGLVARAMLLQRAECFSFKRLLNGGKLITLGTPHRGSFEIPQLLMGVEQTSSTVIDIFAKKHVFSDGRERARKEVLEVLNSFPGTYQLLPALGSLPGVDLQKLYEQTTYRGVPLVGAHLQAALDSHKRLQKAVFPDGMISIIGTGQPTAVGIADFQNLDQLSSYIISNRGDGRVSEELALLSGVESYRVTSGHGELTEHPSVLAALEELLPEKGTTKNLKPIESGPKVRGTETLPVENARARRSWIENRESAQHELVERTQRLAGKVRALRGAQGIEDSVEVPDSGLPAKADPDEIIVEEILARGWLGPQANRGSTPIGSEHSETSDFSCEASDSDSASGDASSSGPPPKIIPIVIQLADEYIENAYRGIWDPVEAGLPESEVTPIDSFAVGQFAGLRSDSAAHALDLCISNKLKPAWRTAPNAPDLVSDTDEGKRANEAAPRATGCGPNSRRPPELPEQDLILHQILQRGIFQGELGELFFLNAPSWAKVSSHQDALAAVTGLGVPGRFGPPELALVIRQLCWALGSLGRRHLGTVLIGGRGSGLSVEMTIRAWLRGIAQAINELPKQRFDSKSFLQKITIFEKNPTKALQIHKILSEMNYKDERVEFQFQRWSDELVEAVRLAEVTAAQDEVRRRQKQTDQPTRGDERIVRMSAEFENDEYSVSLITNEASIPERKEKLDRRIIQDANERIVSVLRRDEQRGLGEFLTRLAIPGEFRPFVFGGDPVVFVVDRQTARIHWEMLSKPSVPGQQVDDNDSEMFLGIGRGLTRQFKTTFAPTPAAPADEHRRLRVLIIGDPAENAPLPGAREEAVEVADLFASFHRWHPTYQSIEVRQIIGPREATRVDVLYEVMSSQYDILHFAGHCFFDVENPLRSGWIFGKDENLSASELRWIDRMPSFVFSNACESGITPDEPGSANDRLAPSFAEAFFERGVQNFICTGWPVGDSAAREFACRVYAGLLGLKIEDQEGRWTVTGTTSFQSMHESLHEARKALFASARGRGTWGAYQHYGNPFSRLLITSQKSDEGAPGARPSGAATPDSPKSSAGSETGVSGSGARFGRITKVISDEGRKLKAQFGAISLRPGYLFDNGRVTDKPCLVIVVPPGQIPENPPREIEGVLVDFAPATPSQMLGQPENVRKVGAIARLPEGPAIPGEIIAVREPEPEDDAVRGKITAEYVPADVKLKRVNASMKVTCHLSPDTGWEVLSRFLQGTTSQLTVGMYDFTAPHILEGLQNALTGKKERLRLVLDPGQSLTTGGDESDNPKAHDKDEDEVHTALSGKLRKRLDFVWAAVKVSGKTTGSIFPSAYHIKVAVRDRESFWLSSGNWQSSNQPPFAPPEGSGLKSSSDPFDGTNAKFFSTYNREWHVVVESPELAEIFQAYLEQDFEQAIDLQEQSRSLMAADLTVPDIVIPPDEEDTRGAADLRFFPATTFGTNGKIDVQPLLTPDNYAEHVLKVIKDAKKKLYFQNQYIKIGKTISPEFKGLLDALKDACGRLDDVRIILRKLPASRDMLEALVDFGFPPKCLKLMVNTHTKGIIADSKVVAVGSHNWSSDGVTRNRDASLIFFDQKIAEYYEKAFLHDWENRATAAVFNDRTMPRLATGTRGDVPRGLRVPGLGYFDEE